VTTEAKVLRELASVFLRLGVTSFGGPAAHIALMDHELVGRRRWLTREEFLDLLGVTNLIPGPNSTEMAIHVGRVRGGGAGLLVSGVCFIAPAALLALVCGWAYVAYGTRPAAVGLLYGAKPVVLVIVVQAMLQLGRTALRRPASWAAALVAVALLLAGVHELVVLLAAGGLAWAAHRASSQATARALGATLAMPWGLAALPLGPAALFLVFLKIGAVLYGSGYVLLAFLRADLVERYHWLTEGQLLDAVAVGQITPGPLFTTATFIGYVLAGPAGAAAATLGIFLPAFVLVAATGPLIVRLRGSSAAAAFLDGVNAASLALMGAASFLLARHAVSDAVTAGVAAAAALLLLRFRVASSWVVLGGALVGIAAKGLG
jgi:chromate transporter